MSDVAQRAVMGRLESLTEITALVGTRIYPRLAPQQGSDAGARPYLIVMHPPGVERVQTFAGPGSVARTPIVVACVADSYQVATQCGAAVEAALCPSGWTGSAQWAGVEVGSCQMEDAFDKSALPELADEIGSPTEFVAFTLEHATSVAE